LKRVLAGAEPVEEGDASDRTDGSVRVRVITSANVHGTLRPQPNLEELTRALLSIAQDQQAKKRPEEQDQQGEAA
jgi:hypothetical protein